MQLQNNQSVLDWLRTNYLTKAFNQFKPSVAFYRETSHLICSANQTTGFYMKCNTVLERVKWEHISEIVGNHAKGRISRRVLQENQVRQIFRKTIISYPLVRTLTCTYSGGKKCSFFGKFGLLCFLVTPILRFTCLPYYRRNPLVQTWSQSANSLKHYFTRSKSHSIIFFFF